MDKITAINEILRKWGVPDSSKMDAIKLIIADKDSDAVILAVDRIRDAVADLYTLADSISVVRRVD